MKEARRLTRITVNDDIQFKYNYEVMNACFDGHYSTYFDDATVVTGDGCLVWFPKAEYNDKNDRWRPGSSRVNWKNEVLPNGDVRQWLYEDEFPSKGDEQIEYDPTQIQTPMHCFMQDSHNGQDYKYIGTVLDDSNTSTLRNRICRRIGTDIDLSVWYRHDDFSYFDREIHGYEYLKDIYIGHSYDIQKQYEDKFRNNIDVIIDDDRILKENAKLFRERFSISSIPRLEGEYETKFLPEFCQGIGKLLNVIISIQDLNPYIEYFEKAGALVDIINVKNPLNGEVNRHNGIIRHSVFGEEVAGIIIAAYFPEYFLYSLTEEETEYYLDKLAVSYREDDDLTEKHCLLQFWKQCNPTMSEWSNYTYYRFLEVTFGNPIRSSSVERSQLNDCSPYTFSRWLDQKKQISIVRDTEGRAFVRKITRSDNLPVIKKLQELDNPGLPHIYSIKQIGSYIIIIEEFMAKGTLEDMLEKGVLPFDKVVDLGIELCDILIALHSQVPPIIHKDIKPDNIAFRKDKKLVLLDFNISREFNEEKTQDTVVAGTIGFAAPEQLRMGVQTDVRTDIFAVGETLYYALTKSHNINRFGAGELKDLILKCTEQNPDDRFQNAAELKDELLLLK